MSDGPATTPFWHEAAPPEPPSGTPAPARVDVAIVGAGLTGLNAARALAGAGRSVAVFEAGAPGAGASTRNGGMLGWGHRASITAYARRYGAEIARAMLAEARRSLDYTLGLIADLGGDVGYRPCGRFLGAATPRHFDRLVTWARDEAALVGMTARVVPRAEQGAHVASDLYHGGLYFPQHGALHPGLFHAALLAATRAAGAGVIDHCPVRAVAGGPGDWGVTHATGTTRAGEIVYAANGYTGGGAGPFAAFARRLLPIPSYIIATEPLGPGRIGGLFPGGRMIVETRSVHSYFRPDPSAERILYGGRASLNVIDERTAAARLRGYMLGVFPGLEDVALTHSWRGMVAMTFDGAPHVGQLGGIWHACGYNGSGLAMAPYLGWRLAQRMMGNDQGRTGFDPVPFPTQPRHRGDPWVLALVEAWMQLQDRCEGIAVRRR